MARDIVFEPLEMKNTSYLWQERFETTYCNGHTTEQGIDKKDKRDRAAAAASMETNLIDYSLFVMHVLKLTKAKSDVTNVLFKPNFRIRTKAQFGPLSLVESHDNNDMALSYGLGWGLLQSPYGFGAFKEGYGEGFQHYTIIISRKRNRNCHTCK